MFAMFYYFTFRVNFWIMLELQVPRIMKASMVRRSFGSSSLRGRSFSNQGSYWLAIVDNLNELLNILRENCVSVYYLLYIKSLQLVNSALNIFSHFRSLLFLFGRYLPRFSHLSTLNFSIGNYVLIPALALPFSSQCITWLFCQCITLQSSCAS